MARTTALVTGASSGIGRELARVCAREGHDLVVVARDERRLTDLADELRAKHGVAVKVLPKDLSRLTSAEEIAEELRRDGTEVELLVNDAGYAVYGDFAEIDLAEELDLIRVNLIALTQLTKLFVRGMRERGHGRILNLASTASFVPSPRNAVYSATKAYILNFSEAVGEELAGSGVTVTALCPGVTRTEFHQRAGMMGVRVLRYGVMSAAEVAEIGYRAMMRGKRVEIAGFRNKLQMLGVRLAPRAVVVRAAKSALGERH